MKNNRLNIPENLIGIRPSRVTASAGDELSLLVNLVRNEQIGVKMLLQNVNEILADDPGLLVDVVLLITDSNRISEGDADASDFASALVEVERDGDAKTKIALVSAINHAAIKAGFLALPS